ncbi:hypothetical protein [Bradyrhizobium yuanmingense]|uniref:hypothetical protein n=1 Tax=Bradyrhizobium yuanmingense TaxID=108015 RepID=UPI001CD3F018|nr:hypothetical protein [Bradyrhizobium yuanmingense]MCA1526512.1 hypothetical protein [Bradyrhizobium yuanmingense]
MTDEAIKALMLLAMYGILELVLYFSPIGRPAKQPTRSTLSRASNSDPTVRWSED